MIFFFFCHIAKLVIIMLLFTHSTQVFIRHCATYNLEVDINNKTPLTRLDLFTFFQTLVVIIRNVLSLYIFFYFWSHIFKWKIFSLWFFFCILFFKDASTDTRANSNLSLVLSLCYSSHCGLQRFLLSMETRFLDLLAKWQC